MNSKQTSEIIKDIKKQLFLKGRVVTEGSGSPEELAYLSEVVTRYEARRVVEIGFNAGFSSAVFLETHPDVTVLSFDICAHSYVRPAKSYIDKKYPQRHTLIEGDSTETVPRFAKSNPTERFDLIFIDGGHAYEIAKQDIENMKDLATPQAAVIMDDLTPWLRWGEGPSKAWREALAEGLVRQKELFQDGKAVQETIPPGKRAWALGEYIFN